jgi:hypothetical protein
MRKDCISGSEAVELAMQKRARLNLLPPQSGPQELEKPGSDNDGAKKAPPRLLREPAKCGDVHLAPKAQLQAHKAAFREVFGNTLSDEFVDEMLTQLVSSLAPSHWDQLEPATLNAAIAIIASVKPQTELEALLAVQITATGFASLKFLQRSQMHLEEAYISVYGGYGTRLVRLQLELIQALDKHRHSHKQTVQARDVHIHSGAQGVVGIINSRKDGSDAGKDSKDGQDGSPAPDNSSQSKS